MSDPFIGEIRLFGFSFCPRDWAVCAGALMSISQNGALFSLLGTAYGGDGRTSFGLPDLRGRAAMSQGHHPGSSFDWRIGQVAGAETHTLTASELANHTHEATFTATGSTKMTATLTATTDAGESATPVNGAFLAAATPPAGGPDKPEKIYKAAPKAGSTVALGGVEVTSTGTDSGNVTVGATGNNQEFSILQPILIMNYCIAEQGIFPPRS